MSTATETLPSWITATSTALDRAINADQSRAQIEHMRGFADDLTEFLRDLGPLVTAAKAGAGTWWPGMFVADELLQSIVTAQADLTERQVGSVVRQIRPLTRGARSQLVNAWKQHVDTKAGNTSELGELVRVLSTTPGFKELATQLDGTLAALRRQTGVPAARDVTTLDDALRLLAELERKLPPAVKAFVQSAAHGGAALADVNDEVRAWLASNNAGLSFKIVPGAPQGGTRE